MLETAAKARSLTDHCGKEGKLDSGRETKGGIQAVYFVALVGRTLSMMPKWTLSEKRGLLPLKY